VVDGCAAVLRLDVIENTLHCFTTSLELGKLVLYFFKTDTLLLGLDVCPRIGLVLLLQRPED
jgi:hypothetical protein